MAGVRGLAAACAAALLCLATAGTAVASRWAVRWPPMPQSLASGVLTAVSCSSISACSAVGTSTDQAGRPFPLVERWNGSTWATEAVPTPPGSTEAQLAAVSCSPDGTCVGVGDFTTRDATYPLIERRLGGNWAIVQASTRTTFEGSSLVDISCTAADACTAVGSNGMDDRPLVERWDGTGWTVQSTPKVSESALEGVACSSPDVCSAVGHRTNPKTGCAVPLIERWTSGRWRRQSGSKLRGCGNATTLSGVSCPSPSFCLAVGYDNGRQTSSGLGTPLAERWNGTTWKATSMPDITYLEDPWGGGGALLGVSCTSPGLCTAAGGVGSDIILRPLVERWNGKSWTVDPTPALPVHGQLNSVSCVYSALCTAVGYDDTRGGTAPTPMVESTFGWANPGVTG